MRHVEMGDTNVRERVDNSGGERRNRAHVGGFRDAFGTQWMMGTRGDGVVRFPFRRLHRGWQEVIHERVAQQIALRVKRPLVTHGHRKSFGESTVDLAFDDHRIDARAAVVERVETTHLRFAGGPIDVDDTQIDAERVGEIRWVVVVHGFQARLKPGRRLVVGLPRDVRHGLEA